MKLGLQIRLFSSSMTGILLLSSFLIFFAYKINKLESVHLKNLNQSFKAQSLINSIEINIVQVQQWVTDISATRGEDGLDDGLKEAEKHFLELNKQIDVLSKLFPNNENLKNSLSILKKNSISFFETGKKMANLYIEGGTSAGNAFMEEFDKAASNFQESFLPLKKSFVNTLQKSKETLQSSLQSLSKISLWITILGFIFSSLMAFIISQKIIQRLEMVSGKINSVLEKTFSIVEGLKKKSENLSEMVSEQATAIQESVSSMDEISAMVQKSSDSSSLANTISVKSSASAEDGKSRVQDVIGAINDIAQNNEKMLNEIEESNRNISQITEVIHNIEEKTKVINDIVFQTKLLSFNASVEAARAGEHGKGFAVVAEEVGNLAQMSGNASHEISSLLEESVRNVEYVVNSNKQRVESILSHGKDKVQEGVRVSRQCDDALTDILRNVAQSKDSVNEIAFAAKEQTVGIKETNIALNNLNTISHRNSEISREVSHESQNLFENASELNKTIDDLNELIYGKISKSA